MTFVREPGVRALSSILIELWSLNRFADSGSVEGNHVIFILYGWRVHGRLQKGLWLSKNEFEGQFAKPWLV